MAFASLALLLHGACATSRALASNRRRLCFHARVRTGPNRRGAARSTRTCATSRSVSVAALPSASDPTWMGVECVRQRDRFLSCLQKKEQHSGDAVPIEAVLPAQWAAWTARQSQAVQQWIRELGIVPKETPQTILIPDFGRHANSGQGAARMLQKVAFVLGTAVEAASPDDPWIGNAELWWSFGALPRTLPSGMYTVSQCEFANPDQIALAWTLGAYTFTAFQRTSKHAAATENTDVSPAQDGPQQAAVLLVQDGDVFEKVVQTGKACFLGRDLINTPAQNMGPEAVEKAVRELAAEYEGARVSSIVGDDLLEENYPQIHAVGRSALGFSGRSPRLIRLEWGMDQNKDAPLVAIVGKCITFDTGGLQIKPAASMRLMKKDMGGAAAAVALTEMILATKLKMRVILLLPAADNAVGPDAYRPGDVLTARNGLTTEIEHTDAEGRLVLADALVAACEHVKPALLIDFATLTGAQRVAMGSEIGSVFCSDPTLLDQLEKQSRIQGDYMWPLPMYTPYKGMLSSTIATMKNCATGGLAGAITAALYLKAFVRPDVPWMHLDINGFNNTARHGRPEGGEVMGARAIFHFIEEVVVRHPKSS
ncbi:putative cytosol aminopeptidase [Porphyridium purpureum]|uniref:Putative cytosol aminopeptidase n=1 Tax=Porphyridium purpureum TaxID=35688 RepID=A0A5J4YX85_PORPP|nr:putative cytosol aminopeptidase [Porphyridium purpureum]|eukprot:POR3427..scf209_3